MVKNPGPGSYKEAIPIGNDSPRYTIHERISPLKPVTVVPAPTTYSPKSVNRKNSKSFAYFILKL